MGKITAQKRWCYDDNNNDDDDDDDDVDDDRIAVATCDSELIV